MGAAKSSEPPAATRTPPLAKARIQGPPCGTAMPGYSLSRGGPYWGEGDYGTPARPAASAAAPGLPEVLRRAAMASLAQQLGDRPFGAGRPGSGKLPPDALCKGPSLGRAARVGAGDSDRIGGYCDGHWNPPGR